MRPILYILLFVSTLAAEQLRISSSQDWNAWSLPGDAVSIEGGQLQPGFVRAVTSMPSKMHYYLMAAFAMSAPTRNKRPILLTAISTPIGHPTRREESINGGLRSI
jgi:hypothetical protein